MVIGPNPSFTFEQQARMECIRTGIRDYDGSTNWRTTRTDARSHSTRANRGGPSDLTDRASMQHDMRVIWIADHRNGMIGLLGLLELLALELRPHLELRIDGLAVRHRPERASLGSVAMRTLFGQAAHPLDTEGSCPHQHQRQQRSEERYT
jgi:hypothetical protein